MSRVCTICKHPEREAIDTGLVTLVSYRNIAKRYDVSTTALVRHHDDHLPADLVKAKEAEAIARNTNVLMSLIEAAQRIKLLSDACDMWLRDADDPTRYDIGPRSEEVWVTYEIELDDGKTKRQKARLSELLDRVAGLGSMLLVETKSADPRDLVLKCYDRLQGELELIAKVLGLLTNKVEHSGPGGTPLLTGYEHLTEEELDASIGRALRENGVVPAARGTETAPALPTPNGHRNGTANGAHHG